MDKKRKEIITGLLFLGALVFAGLDSCLYSVRIDATSSGMFTISDVSRNLFKDITDQVRITYFFTSKLADTNPVYGQIEDILRAYADSSHGRIKLAVVDPVKENREREVEEYGIRQFPVGRQTSEEDLSLINNASSGILIQYLDRHRVIPRVQSTDTLEYDLSSFIRSLVSNRSKKIGYLVDAPEFDYQTFSNLVTKPLQGYMDFTEIHKDNDVPQTLDALVIFGGTGFTDFDLYPIDQYIMRGGRVIFSADPVKIINQPQIGIFGTSVENAPLFSLLKTYGVTVSPEVILEHPDLALQIGNGFRYNYCFNTYQDFVSKDNPITSRMRPITFFWASPLAISPPSGEKAETLVSTSHLAAAMKEMNGQGFRLDPATASLNYQRLASDHKQSYPLVAALSGIFPSSFKDKQIPTKEGVKKDWAKTEPASTPTRLIVIGDSEIFSPQYVSQVSPGNGGFLINCLDWLTNDEDLLSIRNRAAQDTLMAKIQDPDARKTAVTVIIIINLVALPILVIGIGVLSFLLRRRTKKSER
ncbi:MAG: GldG family protein [Spirochaetales bacterium]|nr:GldG family protein [Spirochaetales bacterium]